MTIRTAATKWWLAAGALALPMPAWPAAFDVPLTHATLQAAVAAAAASVDVENVITISVSPVLTNTTVDIGAAFGPARHLTIRPAVGLDRASLVNGAPNVTVVQISSAANVTLQDLDILRNVTNDHHIVGLDVAEDIVIERCRIGSNAVTAGTPGWANVHLTYPTNVLLRNNILFARTNGTFDFALDAGSFLDPANALRLYNNVFANYRLFGARIDAMIPGPLVLLRNNIAVNAPGLAPEPVAYRTQVALGGPTVVTSHNSAFASAGFEQTGPAGTADIAGLAASFAQRPKAAVAATFVAAAWTPAPAWDANPNFYRLIDGGPLHQNATHYGTTVASVGNDVAVTDDIERDLRPSGIVPHTDRGPDQLELSTRLDAPAAFDAGLRAAPRRNPAPGVFLSFEASEAGQLRFEVIDAAGRRLHASERALAAHARGVLDWAPPDARVEGLVFYRLRLVAASGRIETVTGKLAVLR